MPKYRILSMDGASVFDGGGYVTVGLLQQMHRRLGEKGPRGHFLDRVNLFAGTSSGGWTALFLASQENPSDALGPRGKVRKRGPLARRTTLVDFWEELAEALSPRRAMSLERTVMAAFGLSPLLSYEHVREVLIRYFGERATLRDLNHPVMITTFQLDNPRSAHRRWKPKIFHNFGKDDPHSKEKDLDEKVVDVALRTAAAPIVGPIVQGLAGEGPGYVDGGIFANNPALCAISQALYVHRRKEIGRPSKRHGKMRGDEVPPAMKLEDISLLSMGNGSVPAYANPAMSRGMAEWGYGPWLLDPAHLGRLLHMVMEAGVTAVHYQCTELLRGNYQRLEPEFAAPPVAFSGNEVPQVLEQTKRALQKARGIKAPARQGRQRKAKSLEQEAMDWFSATGWFEEDGGRRPAEAR